MLSSKFLSKRYWNNFFEREFYEYLSNGLAIMDMSNYYGKYLFQNPESQNYISNNYSQGVPGFSTGGQDKSHTARETIEMTTSIKLNMQLNKNHNLVILHLYYKIGHLLEVYYLLLFHHNKFFFYFLRTFLLYQLYL